MSEQVNEIALRGVPFEGVSALAQPDKGVLVRDGLILVRRKNQCQLPDDS
jgi:hypothetical protein